MKKTLLLAAIAAAAIPLVTVSAEDTASPTPKPTEQTKEEESSGMVMMGSNKGGMMGMMSMMGMGNMMSNWQEQDAELDKLVAALNSASPDKKLDALTAVVTKLVEQRKAMHEGMQKMMATQGKEMMKMGRMMMGGDKGMMMQGDKENQGNKENQDENEHSKHHQKQENGDK